MRFLNKLSFQLVIVGILAQLFSACAMIHSKSVSDLSKGQGHRIVAADSGLGILMLTIPDLDSAAHLRAQCQGNITGVQTTLSSRNWLGVIQAYEEKSEGWCQ